MKKKILIVDDEEDLTWSISKGLTRESQAFEVICANSGSMALDILSQKVVDLLVTDLRMPGMSGSELIQKVKQNYPKIKVIIMTAYSQLEGMERGNGKSLPMIEKPFEIHELRNLINKSLHFS
ncbi:response regulator [bacterium]